MIIRNQFMKEVRFGSPYQIYYNDKWYSFYPMLSNTVPDRRPTRDVLTLDKIYGRILIRIDNTTPVWVYLTVEREQVFLNV